MDHPRSLPPPASPLLDRSGPTLVSAELQRRVDVLDGVPDPVVAVSDDGRIVEANATAVRTLGAVVGVPVDGVLGGGMADWLARCGATPDERPCDARTPAGVRPALVRAARTAGADLVVLAVRLDPPQRGGLGATGALAGAVAHEINNPLTVLQLRTDLLLEETRTADVLRRQLVVLRDCAARIARMVRTLQHVTREPRVAPEPVEVGTVVASGVGAATAGYPSPALTVALEVPEDTLLLGDPDALTFIVEAVLAHALDGGPTSLVVRADDPASVSLVISCRAPPWPEGTLADLAPKTTPVGIAVAAALARAHGGSVVGARDLDGAGTLTVTLPRAPGPP